MGRLDIGQIVDMKGRFKSKTAIGLGRETESLEHQVSTLP
jgi:hypothetical protein